jgi:hypothetical protein
MDNNIYLHEQPINKLWRKYILCILKYWIQCAQTISLQISCTLSHKPSLFPPIRTQSRPLPTLPLSGFHWKPQNRQRPQFGQYMSRKPQWFCEKYRKWVHRHCCTQYRLGVRQETACEKHPIWGRWKYENKRWTTQCTVFMCAKSIYMWPWLNWVT